MQLKLLLASKIRCGVGWDNQDNSTDEMCIKYDMKKIALLNGGSVGTYRNKDQYIDIDYHSSLRDKFDVCITYITT